MNNVQSHDFSEAGGDVVLVTPNATPAAIDPPVMYHGFTVRETGASTASFTIEERTAGNVFVRVLENIGLAASAATGDFYPNGIMLDPGNRIYLNHLSGAYTGGVRFSDGVRV